MPTMKVSLVSVGIDSDNNITHQALLALKNADLLLGEKTLIEKIATEHYVGAVVPTKGNEDMLRHIRTHLGIHTVIVFGGDLYYNTNIDKLVQMLDQYEVEVISGTSLVQYMAYKLNKQWHDVKVFTPTENTAEVIGTMMSNTQILFTTSQQMSPQKILMTLFSAGFGSAQAFMGSNLGLSNESIVYTTVSRSAKQLYDDNTVIWVTRKPIYLQTSYKGLLPTSQMANILPIMPIQDDMLRAQIVAKLGRDSRGVFYDIGAGIGAIAVELALANPFSQVYAFEKDLLCAQGITDNRKKFGAHNLTIASTELSEALSRIAPPTAVFIGDFRGHLIPLLDQIWNKNPACRIALTTTVVEVLAQAVALFKSKKMTNYSITQLCVNNTTQQNGYIELIPQPPQFLITVNCG